MRRKGLILLALFSLVLVLVYCSPSSEKDEDAGYYWLNHSDSVAYVGMDACRQCHSDKFESFVHTGMGQSFHEATRQKSVASYHRIEPVYDAFSDFYYYPYWEDSALFIMEYRLTKQGDTIHKRTEQISYIVGSGQHTNSHIIALNGFLYQAPLTWYAQKGKWDLPPGYENGQNSRFSRMIGQECMSCHNALPDFDRNSINRFSKVPGGIDCERCHGPGQLHVEQKRAGILVDITKEADRTIVNPRRLSWELQTDLCQRCHLQGNIVLEPGKDFHDFKPGMRLKDIMNVYMPRYEGKEEEFMMASHAQRLQMSRCFIRSNTGDGEMKFSCITCHDPHVSVKVTGKQVFNAACGKCHQTDTCTELRSKRASKGNNCVECHMPSSSTLDIPHVSVHDHYIRKPVSAPIDTAVKRFAGLYAVNNADPSVHSRIRAYLSQYEKFDRDDPQMLDSAEKMLIAGGKQYIEEWIQLAFLKNDYEGVSVMAGEYSGSDAWTHYRIGRSYHILKMYEQAESHFRKACETQQYNLDFQNALVSVWIETGRYEEALKRLNLLLEWQPKQEMALMNRAWVYEKTGREGEAIRDYEAALALNPDYLLALINLYRIREKNGQHKEAGLLLRRIRVIHPDFSISK